MAVTVTNAPATGRKRRMPRHNFQLRHKPFVIQPFMIAPVLPGETLKSAVLQARAVSKPIANPIVGWWLEHYLFYVKHRDLVGRDDFTEMMLDLDKDMSAYNTAAATVHYHSASSFNWSEMCLQRVTEEYFRDEGETWNADAVDGLPLARVNTDNLSNSAVLNDDFITPADESLVVGVDDTITASEVDSMMRTWQFQRANGLTPMDYEDWLATYGIQPKAEEHHRPELVRYLREWQYPSNTVDPATGIPASAVSWSISDRADKDRFFREPGFLYGVTVARPKIYFRNQNSSGVDWMRDALTWLPAIMRDDPWTSLKKFEETEGPFQVVSDADGYWVDIKDLFIHGDQFVNFTMAGVTNGSFVDLPTAALNCRYVASADIDGLFPGVDKYVQQDGVCQLTVLGALMDTTPAITGSRIG